MPQDIEAIRSYYGLSAEQATDYVIIRESRLHYHGCRDLEEKAQAELARYQSTGILPEHVERALQVDFPTLRALAH